MKIIAATKNAHKVKEFSEMLNIPSVELVSLKDMGFDGEIEENGSTFEENSAIKARFVCRKYGLPAIADDSGLCVDYLSGAPGIYSARYASADGHNSDDRANVDKLLGELRGVSGADRSARFVCAITIAMPDGYEKTVTGTCEGLITNDIRGSSGFGYDPVFYYVPYAKTFGETTDEEKNAVSHRSAAVSLIKEELLKLLNV